MGTRENPTTALENESRKVGGGFASGSYLEALSEHFIINEGGKYFLLSCKHCVEAHTRNRWKLYREAGMSDISKSNYNALLAHALAAHKEETK